MAFTEFYCQSGGSNLNAGSTTDNVAPYSFTAGTWVQATRVLTVGSTTGVTVGMWISIYTSGATATTYIARITAVTGTTITTDSSAKMGSAPVNGTYDAKVGGACRGLTGTAKVPFNLIGSNAVNSSGDPPRLNIKNDVTYAPTSLTSLVAFENSNRAVRFQGYSTTPGDGGIAIIDGGTSGASYSIFQATDSTAAYELADLEIKNNGATNAVDGLIFTNGAVSFERCIIHDFRGRGISTANAILIECEVYGCNQSNTSNYGGVVIGSGGVAVLDRCTIHDNTGSNTSGVYSSGHIFLNDCIIDSNGKHGVQSINNTLTVIKNSVFYNNTNDGFAITGTSGFFRVLIENSDFFKNGGYGINVSTVTGSVLGNINYCRYGSGTQANTSGQVTIPRGISQLNAVTYTSNLTPYNDPANGDFTCTDFQEGRASWTNTQSGYGDTVGFSYIGPSQPESGGGGGGGANTTNKSRLYGGELG
jgi:hypothetical protein